MINPSDLLTTIEAAKYLRLSLRTLERYRKDRCGPVYIRLLQRIFYNTRDLDQWLRDHRTL